MHAPRGMAIVAALALTLISAAAVTAQSEDAAMESDAVQVTGIDYAYQNLPTSLPAGSSLAFDNAGTELHELVVARIADDTTESIDELMAMGPEAVTAGKVEMVGPPLIANPGETADGALALEREGRYVAICFIPQGFVPETLAELGVTEDMMGPEADPAGLPPEVQALMANPPHAALGMVQAFDVTAAGTEVGPMPEAMPAEEEAAA